MKGPRVAVRGGCFFLRASIALIAALRFGDPVADRGDHLGFRASCGCKKVR